MTIPEARAEIKSAYEQAKLIEEKYPDPETMPAEDLKQVKALLTNIDGLEAKLAVLEDADQRRNRLMAGVERYARPAPGQHHANPVVEDMLQAKKVSPGEQFVLSREYRELKSNGAFQSSLNRVQFGVNLLDGTSLIEWKDLLYGSSATSGGAFVQNDRLPGMIDIRQREVRMLDIVPRLTTSSDTVEYVQENTFTNAAAFTAEATATTGTTGEKPESALAYATATATVRTLAHWIPITNRMLDDAPAVRGLINSRLLMGLNLTLESQIVSGDGTGDNFTGILATSGICIQAAGTDSVLDRMFKGRGQVRVTGRGIPSAYIIHPNDWAAIRLARQNVATGTLGDYLMGPPSQVGAVTVWGIPVVESDVETENTVLVGDFAQGCSLFDREQAAIRVGTIGDQFIRNMQTILAELRAAFVVWRPAMFCRITGV